MFKTITTITLLFAFSFSNAQSKNYVKEKGTFIKISTNIAHINSKQPGSNSSSGEARIGYGLGIERAFAFSNRAILSTQVALHNRGSKNVRINYVDVPIAFNYLFGKDIIFMFGGGVYAGYAVSGSYNTLSNGWKKIKFGESKTDNRSNLDAGIVINFGISFWGDGKVPFLSCTILSGKRNIVPKDVQAINARSRTSSTQLTLSLPLQVFKK